MTDTNITTSAIHTLIFDLTQKWHRNKDEQYSYVMKAVRALESLVKDRDDMERRARVYEAANEMLIKERNDAIMCAEAEADIVNEMIDQRDNYIKITRKEGIEAAALFLENRAKLAYQIANSVKIQNNQDRIEEFTTLAKNLEHEAAVIRTKVEEL